MAERLYATLLDGKVVLVWKDNTPIDEGKWERVLQAWGVGPNSRMIVHLTPEGDPLCQNLLAY